MSKPSDIKIKIDGKEYVGWTAISKVVGIPRKTIRERVNKKGWILKRQ